MKNKFIFGTIAMAICLGVSACDPGRGSVTNAAKDSIAKSDPAKKDTSVKADSTKMDSTTKK